MPLSPRPASRALIRIGSAGSGLARWLLVLLLAMDLIGSPLHGHVHDSGVDGHDWTAHVDAPGMEPAHAEESDTSVPLRHTTLTIRAAAQAGDLVAEGHGADVLLAWWPVFALLAALPPVREQVVWPGAPPPPDLPDHRSLPPAGRAPPLHA